MGQPPCAPSPSLPLSSALPHLLPPICQIIKTVFGQDMPGLNSAFAEQLFATATVAVGLASFALVLALVEQVGLGPMQRIAGASDCQVRPVFRSAPQCASCSDRPPVHCYEQAPLPSHGGAGCAGGSHLQCGEWRAGVGERPCGAAVLVRVSRRGGAGAMQLRMVVVWGGVGHDGVLGGVGLGTAATA